MQDAQTGSMSETEGSRSSQAEYARSGDQLILADGQLYFAHQPDLKALIPFGSLVQFIAPGQQIRGMYANGRILEEPFLKTLVTLDCNVTGRTVYVHEAAHPDYAYDYRNPHAPRTKPVSKMVVAMGNNGTGVPRTMHFQV